jgi:hypothetical protein
MELFANGMTEAQGYFDLGMFEEAWMALDDLPKQCNTQCNRYRKNVHFAAFRASRCHSDPDTKKAL